MMFLEMVQEVSAQLGLDYTNAAQGTLIKRWINLALQDIYSYFNWPFLRGSVTGTVQTEVDVTDVTSSLTLTTVAGNSTATLSGNYATSLTGRYLQTESSLDWYRITAHTANTASLTLEVPALYSGSALTFTARKVYYSLSSSVDRILSVKQNLTPMQLLDTTNEYFDSFQYLWDSLGTPRIFILMGKDSSNNWQFRLWPTPDSTLNLSVNYLQEPSDLSNNTDVPLIPKKWHSVIIEGAKWRGFDFADDTRKTESKTLYGNMLEEMRGNYEADLAVHHVMRGCDELPYDKAFPFPLPPQYPRGS